MGQSQSGLQLQSLPHRGGQKRKERGSLAKLLPSFLSSLFQDLLLRRRNAKAERKRMTLLHLFGARGESNCFAALLKRAALPYRCPLSGAGRVETHPKIVGHAPFGDWLHGTGSIAGRGRAFFNRL